MKADVRQAAPHPDARHRQQRATERKQRYRANQRAGLIMVSVAVSNDVIGMLTDTHWLAEAESEKRERIAAAIRDMLDDAAKHHNP